MKITYKGDYALKTVLELSLSPENELVTSQELAKRIDAPVKFLEQVLSELKKGGFVVSKRGKVGGYMLARPAHDIKIGEVIRQIDGPIEPIACINEGYDDCQHIQRCVFKNLWKKVFDATSGVVDHVTFEDLAQQVRAGNQALEYSI